MGPGYMDGITFYLTPKWEKLLEINVWADACIQIFFSLGVTWGGMITLASYNQFNNNVFRDALLVGMGNCITSFFAGFVIFGIIGYMAHELGVPVGEVAAQGAGLAFIAYPEAVSRMPISRHCSPRPVPQPEREEQKVVHTWRLPLHVLLRPEHGDQRRYLHLAAGGQPLGHLLRAHPRLPRGLRDGLDLRGGQVLGGSAVHARLLPLSQAFLEMVLEDFFTSDCHFDPELHNQGLRGEQVRHVPLSRLGEHR